MDNTNTCCENIPDCCDMRGLLSFSILWLLSKKEMYGQELAEELGKMRGVVPNAGTIYPALSELEKRGLIDRKRRGRKNYYCLTDAGRRGSIEACRYFCTVYEDIFKEYGNIS